MKRMSYFILAVCVFVGITNGQQTDDWFNKLLNQPQQPVVTNNLLFQPQHHQQMPMTQRMLQSNQFSTMHSTRVGAPLPGLKDLSGGMTNVVLGCWNNPCLNGATCIDNQNGFRCQCVTGFTGERCEQTVNVGVFSTGICANNPCMNGGSCKEIEDDSFSCNCMKPWAGNTCNEVWKNPCTEEALRNLQVRQFKNPWDRNSFLICLDVNVHHAMKCSEGTYFNENLSHCVPEGFDPPKCPAGFCLNDGECIVDANNLLKCVCQKGFSGERCQVNIDECALEGNAACQGGMCVDQVNGFYCKCPGGTIGVNCQQTIENPCTDANIANKLQFFELPTWNHNVYLQCTSLSEFTVRKCADNLFWNPEEETCTAERPRVRGGICLTLPCKNGGECVSGGENGFSCKCKRGFTGVTCEEMIDNCASNPCQNGGTCVSFAGGYTCMCANKVVDECCCHNTPNPCPPRKKIIPGVNNYFKHSIVNRYIHCDFEGRAFVRSCAAGTNWNQKVLTCTPDSFYSLNQISPNVEAISPAVGGYGNMHSNLLPLEKALLPSSIVPSKSFTEYQARAASPPVVNAAPVPSYQSSSYQVPEVVTTPQTITFQQAAPVPSYQSSSYQVPEVVTTPQTITFQQAAPVPSYQSSSYQVPEVVTTPQTITFQQAAPAPAVPAYPSSVPVAPTYQPSVPVVPQYQQYQPQLQLQQQQPLVQPSTYGSSERAYKLRAKYNY